MKIRTQWLAVALTAMGVAAGCGRENQPAKTTTEKPVANKTDHDDHAGHTHGEKGPHDGALVMLPGHAAHVEMVLDSATGKLTAYVIDGDAKKAVAVKQDALDVTILLGKAGADDKTTSPDGGDGLKLKLAVVDPAPDGTAHTFAGQSDQLKNVKEFDGVVTSVKIGDKEHTKISFNYPKGNDH